MVPIVTTLSSPGAPDIVRSFPVLFLHDSKKGPWALESCLPQARPRFQAQQWRPYWQKNLSPQIDDLTWEYESPRERAAGHLERIPWSLLGEDFRRHKRLRRERKQVVWIRDCSPKLYKSKWSFPDDLWCDSCWRKRRRWTLWYSKMRWVVLKTYLVTLLSPRFLTLNFALKVETTKPRNFWSNSWAPRPFAENGPIGMQFGLVVSCWCSLPMRFSVRTDRSGTSLFHSWPSLQAGVARFWA